MKKSVLILIIILVAAAASAATLGIMHYLGNRGESIIIVSDERCKNCNTAGLKNSLEQTFPGNKIKVLDYTNRKGKEVYKNEKLSKLPAVLLPKRLKKSEAFTKIARFTEPGRDYIKLRTGGRFDPTAEICDNNIDDNGNNLVDCEDPTCKSNWVCMEKKETPEVELFVMSHCPYGTQIEKGLLPVWDLIGDKIDLQIKFCDYAMHGEKEIKEQIRQYCIQKIDKAKYRKYLECFLKEGASDDKCVNKVGINKSELASCAEKTDKKHGLMAGFKDKNKWKGRFPPFALHADEAQKYGVKGSPTLIINGVKTSSGRSSDALLDAICKGFKEKPKECEKELDKSNPSPGFGFSKSAGSTDASCGT